MFNEEIINETLDYIRGSVGSEIGKLIHKKRLVLGAYDPLYELMSDYPFRKGKALRPALCISVARAVGGTAQSALISSVALEMYHNAFLLHDDIQDDSDIRRGKQTMHKMVGVPRAINLGDATNVLALSFLLENLNTVGVSKALHIMHEIENMARQSVEGQSMELDWIANNTFGLDDNDYFKMCAKKTCWYTFITPCRIGYIAGNPVWKEHDADTEMARLTEFGMALGVAFQIQDDLLNLVGNEKKYGKEIAGDIFEGKRTIMLNHVIANAGSASDQIKEILMKPRSSKTQKEVNFILAKMKQCGSIDYGKSLALKYADKTIELLGAMDFLKENRGISYEENWDCAFADKRFITELVNYVVYRHV